MFIQIFFKRFTLLTAALVSGTICFSQHKNVIGLNVTGENTSSSDFVVGIGGTFARQVKKHYGFETGLCYRTFEVHQRVFVDGSLYGFHNIREEYLSIPVLYKFCSSLLNISLGPTFDACLGWEQIKKGVTFGQKTHTVNTRFHIGLMGKISKNISLTDRISLEPEMRYNPVFLTIDHFTGRAFP